MKEVRGDIFDDDKLIVQNVTISLIEEQSHAGSGDWHGNLWLNSDPFSEINKRLRLILSDGRSGKILITDTRPVLGTDLLVFTFLGSGYLS